ncbi:N-formylglutamate amidohydrolase [Piscirickettsia salmonis]|uniref:Cell wall hydrolase/autolysin n=2 Tax=Piscirickettsia salmonis TaxID=1238 RepID=A0A1L6TD02_PISSA|nr:flavohemoglobin expression-modulating QEGLA motif protein [Piscirickettsia salmonis]AKP74341.2 hypothetical protein PSLF89_2758 [Piscirickettsia salmonis LF-89 = ATCC VR-1361]ALB23284.1 Cell wall hydrolase/autolysin [Piscirickettsia salmonis]ALY03190.1 hypothetical protein AWE47_10340 [Piscirickettsia salmonis]AMA42753.1 hypothetical protein AWJ11_10555 [Piscirickettsia salmonis]AOS35225.1 hypothetical protein AVM72_07695 [Piscirickettsia salmonis]
MQMLSEQQVLQALKAGEAFEGVLEGGSLSICVREYVPYVCTAIHAGHQLRQELIDYCNLDAAQRLQEEDPYTDQLIDSLPIALIAKDSRYEYDLNRAPDACIYDQAWGETVWSQPLSEQNKKTSLSKHEQYYRILGALLKSIEQRFGGCLLIDVHSYNWQIRQHVKAPVFNLGTSQLDTKRWNHILTAFEKKLAHIELPNLDVSIGRNTVFAGKGYQATFISKHASNTLIIPLEIKKIFMDEETGEVFPLVLEKLQEGLYSAVLDTAVCFNEKLKRSKLKRVDLLHSEIEPIVITVDRGLYSLAKGMETLRYVNPINIQQEKKRVFANRRYNPEFRYRQLRLDPYDFREKLYSLPVSQIQDPMLRGLYRAVVDNYAIKIELLASVGTPHFLYNSLRYYGEPTAKDIANARFILHAGLLQGEDSVETNISAEEAKGTFEQAVLDYGFTDCQVIVSTRIVAKAMVDNSRRALLINRNAQFSALEIAALIHHELGVHLVTTMNALVQPLSVFRLGLPGDTYTQEGLAVLSEYLSGNINLHRLKQLSLRVVAVDMMVNGMSFSSIFNYLIEEHKITLDESFNLTMRVFRGGGFTKDYLYLSGLRDLAAFSQTRDVSPLLIGKTGLQFIDTLDSLLERQIVLRPQYITPALSQNAGSKNEVLSYLISSIK